MAAIERQIALRKHLAPWLFFVDNKDIPKTKSFISRELPENVHLLTLDSWSEDGNTILIRLEHILEKEDDETLSKDVTVDLTVRILFISLSYITYACIFAGFVYNIRHHFVERNSSCWKYTIIRSE